MLNFTLLGCLEVVVLWLETTTKQQNNSMKLMVMGMVMDYFIVINHFYIYDYHSQVFTIKLSWTGYLVFFCCFT